MDGISPGGARLGARFDGEGVGDSGGRVIQASGGFRIPSYRQRYSILGNSRETDRVYSG